MAVREGGAGFQKDSSVAVLEGSVVIQEDGAEEWHSHLWRCHWRITKLSGKAVWSSE